MTEIDNLSFCYEEGGVDLFSSFSITIKDGERVLLISSPGSGKTTLARILTGSAPKYTGGVIAGHIYVDGVDILTLDSPERMKYVSRVNQNSDEMILFSTLYEELSFPLENMGLEEAEIKKKVEETLELFDLKRYREVSTAELSGGEKKRLMIAILFLIDPSLYILDESFDELSPYWRCRIAALLKAKNKSTLILGSHFLPTYEGLYNRAVSIKDGKLAAYEREPLNESIIEFPNDSKLIAENIKLSRSHRSLKEINPFSLDIPSFMLEGGKCTLLLGENGSGKSTLSKVLCGLLKEEAGSVSINGSYLNAKERRSKVAYLMQNPFEQLFLPTVGEELMSTEASSNEIERALKLFSLSSDWYISEIPYGRAKLVQASVFYLLDRDFAIFDELDSALSYEDSIKAVNAYLEKGTGLLIITHDEYFASLFDCDKYRIEDGRI